MLTYEQALKDLQDYSDTIGNQKAEITRLRAEVKDAQAVCDSYAKENQQFHDEIERLRAALEEIANSTWIAQTCEEAALIARAVLAKTKTYSKA